MVMVDRKWIIFRTAVICATIWCALFFAAPVWAIEPIRIAMITAKTGKAARGNLISFDGARFVVDEINANGGILGRPVELLEYDNLSTPEGSALAGKRAVEDGAIAVVGCNWSSHSLALAEVMQEAKIPMVTHMSTNEDVTRVGDYIFRACYTDSHQGAGMARFAHNRLEANTAVVLVDKGRTYSKGLAATFTSAFEKLGGTVLWRGEYGAGVLDAKALLAQVASYEPDALFVPGDYSDVAEIFGAARDMKVKWHLLSGDGIGIRLIDYIGDRANGVYYTSHWSKWADNEVSRRFVQRYESKAGPVTAAALALVYDSFMLLKDAIERAGTTDGPKLRDALAVTPGYVGVTGTISFDENGDPIKPLFINTFRYGGIMYLDVIYP